jgi:hypothetical protein
MSGERETGLHKRLQEASQPLQASVGAWNFEDACFDA